MTVLRISKTFNEQARIIDLDPGERFPAGFSYHSADREVFFEKRSIPLVKFGILKIVF